MFKDTIKGLDKIFKNDIKPPRTVLVQGTPGSLKSAFIHTLLSKYLSKTGKFGLYATLEETAKSHLENMGSIGVELCLNLQISDYTDLREEHDSIDYIQFTESMIKHFKELKGDDFQAFAFDSLGALYSLTEVANMRKKMYHFFKMLGNYNLFSFLITESDNSGNSLLLGNEGFLADGLIQLGVKRSQGRYVRYIQVAKMRTVRHSMELHAVEVRHEGINVLGPIFDHTD